MIAAAAQDAEPVVYVIDDDDSIRFSLEDLLGSVGLEARTFASAEAFAASPREDRPACVILDIRMPGMSGLDWQREMAAGKDHLPIVFITAHGDVHMSVKAMKAGAIEFLTKPFRDQDLLDAIREGLKLNVEQRAAHAELTRLRACYGALDKREKQIMREVVDGSPSREIATALGLSEITIKVRRRQIMQKMQAGSIPALVRMAVKLQAAEG